MRSQNNSLKPNINQIQSQIAFLLKSEDVIEIENGILKIKQVLDEKRKEQETLTRELEIFLTRDENGKVIADRQSELHEKYNNNPTMRNQQIWLDIADKENRIQQKLMVLKGDITALEYNVAELNKHKKVLLKHSSQPGSEQ